jgi:transcription antitermination protein NusB
MSTARDIRRCAIQALYQLDAQRDAAAPLSKEALLDALEESPGDRETHKRGVDMAMDAWAAHDQADSAVAALSPDWPTHRQPVIDRCILRLAHSEIVGGRTPPKVAINEAVELAREYSTEKSPAFINGILDKIMKKTSKGQNVERSEEVEAE